jgi:hypothetical protein
MQTRSYWNRRRRALLFAWITLALVAAGCGAEDGTEPIPSTMCCDPAEEPGVGDNPTCFEGATCCADGTWQCNGDSGESSCDDFDGLCVSGSCDPSEQPGVGGGGPTSRP